MGMSITYVDSQSITRQGKASEIYKKYGKEWNIKPLGGGNGNWLLTKPSDVRLNGRSCRSFVLSYYNRAKLTVKLVDKFCKDVEDNKIKPDEIYYD